jgi:hypothetical protein
MAKGVTVAEAYVLVQAERRTLPIAGRLGAVQGVSEAHDVSGPYDALDLERIVERIRALPGVLHAIAAPLSMADGRDREEVAA